MEENKIVIDNTIITKWINESEKKLNLLPFYSIKDIGSFKIDKKLGVVYCIYVNNDVKYIGKSTGSYFKTRMKAHFIKPGKGTQSKIDFIQNEQRKGNKVTFKFITTEPMALRNLIEELLIKNHNTSKNLWNFKAFCSE